MLPFKPGVYNRLLLFVAGLGGLLYGVDVGIIAGALPYLEATSGLNAGQLSFIVAAVLLGSVVSTLFAGMLADAIGRRTLMTLSGILFVASIPMIALAHGYGALVLGRLLQGVSGGLIGVVVPLYLAECLGASSRGKGTGIFQWLLTLGIVAAAGIGMYFSIRVNEVAKLGDASRLLAFKDLAWRSIFWVSLPPGVLFVLGSLLVAESPRWLHRRGRRDASLAALLRSRVPGQAEIELKEMDQAASVENAGPAGEGAARSAVRHGSLLRKKYVIPFLLACVILACNQATGINSIIGYNTTILLQAGLSDVQAHWGYVVLTLVNFLTTIAGFMLVDRKGRKFLLSVGTAGIVLSLLAVGITFRRTESRRLDCAPAAQALVTADQSVAMYFQGAQAGAFLASAGEPGRALAGRPCTLTVIYSYGGFRAATKPFRSDDPDGSRIEITRGDCVPANKTIAFFSNPFADLDEARTAPLRIEHALVTPVPGEATGWLTAAFIYVFMAFYAVGPGVCVWLALSELMPTRIRSNGMSIALLINQAVSTTIAAVFLPTVGRHGYGVMFFVFAGCTIVYFVTAAFLLPETKGKTLEEIELLFDPVGPKHQLGEMGRHQRTETAKPLERRRSMDLFTWFLRRFGRFRDLERSVRRLEKSVVELQGTRDRLESEGRSLRAENADWTRFCPLGHFYSPIPSRKEVVAAFSRGGFGPPFPAVDLNLDGQFALLQELAAYYPDLPFPQTATTSRRFYLANPSYGTYDACVLYGIVRHLQPRRIVEVGCGYSSAAILDLDDAMFGGGLALTFVDPDLAQFRRLLLPGETNRATLFEKTVQDVPIEVFETLDANDILLIDSSHVSKVGSDVNHLFFKVLPTLKPGVWVHIHDVTGNFEYPRAWFDEGRAWNEIHVLRAFLMYNRTFKIMFASSLMSDNHHEFLRERMPMCAAGGGGQLWLRREAG